MDPPSHDIVGVPIVVNTESPKVVVDAKLSTATLTNMGANDSKEPDPTPVCPEEPGAKDKL